MQWKLFTSLVIAFFTPFLLSAQVCTWNGGTGDWDDPTKWSCGMIPGPGDTVIIGSGTVNLDMNREVAFLSMVGGTLAGSDTLALSDSLNWVSGNFSGLIMKILTTARVGVSGTSYKYLEDAAQMLVYGEVWQNASILSLAGGSRMIIQNGAACYYEGGQIHGSSPDSLINKGTVYLDCNGVIKGMQFLNTGTILRTAGDGLFNFDCGLVTHGTINLTSGNQVRFSRAVFSNTSSSDFDTSVVLFDGTLDMQASATISNGKRYIFSGSTTLTVNATLPADKQLVFETNPTNFNIDYSTSDTVWIAVQSTIGGSGSLTVSGVILWSGGKVKIPVTCTALGEMQLDGPYYHALEGQGRLNLFGELHLAEGTLNVATADSVVIYSSGQFHFNGGTINGGSGQVILNHGTFSFNFPGQLTNGFLKFINFGTIERTAGTGLINFDCVLINHGMVDNGIGLSIRFHDITMMNGSDVNFGAAIVYFEGAVLLDTFANVTGGKRYIFSGWNMYIKGNLPSDKQLRFESNITYFNISYSTSDTMWIVNGATIGGTGSITFSGYLAWSNGKINIPFECTSEGEMRLTGNTYKSFEGNGRLDLRGTLFLEAGYLWQGTTDTLVIHETGVFYFDGGQIVGGPGQEMVNNGSFVIRTDGNIGSNYFTLFINQGTISRTGGSGIIDFDCDFQHYGHMSFSSGTKVRFSNFDFKDGSTADFGTLDVEFHGLSGTMEALANISGGATYYFSQSTAHVHCTFPAHKKMILQGDGYTYFYQDYEATDTLMVIHKHIGGPGIFTINAYCEFRLGSIRGTTVIGPLGELVMVNGFNRQLSNAGKLVIQGTLTLEGGDFGFTSDDTIRVDPGGTFLFKGGTITSGPGEVIHNKGVFNISFPATMGNSLLKFDNDGIFQSDSTGGTIVMQCQFINDSTIAGNDAIYFQNITHHGIVSPGLSIEALHLSSGLDNSDAAINIEISGFEGEGIGNDLLELEGEVTLHGTLNVNLVDGFVPYEGYCFRILTSEEVLTDSFDVTNLPGPPPQWKVLYTPYDVYVQYFHFECPSDVTIEAEPDACYRTISNNLYDLEAMQSCDDVTVFNELNLSPSLAGEFFVVGAHSVIWNVDDGHGDTLSCMSRITVKDMQAPVYFSCTQGDVELNTNSDGANDYNCSASFSWAHPGLTDNCGLEGQVPFLKYTLTGATSSTPTEVASYTGTTMGTVEFGKGVTTVSYTAQDSSGNPVSGNCAFTVSVIDVESPIIQCPGDVTLEISSASCDTLFTYQVSSADNCPGEWYSILSGIGSGGSFLPGNNVEEWMATDASLNTSVCSFTVDVVPKPVVVPDTICLGDSIYLEHSWRYEAGIYRDTFLNSLLCDSIVHTHLSTTTECYWPSEIVYVDSSASGNNTGIDWANAYVDLQLALDVARRYLNIVEIWITKGHYFTTAASNRNTSFILADHTAILGGFAGTETSNTQRDPNAFPVILSGDLGIMDDLHDDSYHVLICPDTASAVVVDGVTIEHGYADGAMSIDRKGAGVFNMGGMSLINCTFLNVESIEGASCVLNTGGSAILLIQGVYLSASSQETIINQNQAVMMIMGDNQLH